MRPLQKIILVEDDQFDADMTMLALKAIPIANPILWLETGQELLDYLADHGTKDIAVVILDLNMPILTGLEALTIIRETLDTQFPVVVVSSSNQHPDVKRAYELGVNSFITKPVDPTEFSQAIRTVGLYWGILNQLP